MPTSSEAGFTLRSGAGGGAEAPFGSSHVPWRAAVGKRVRLVCSVAGRRRRIVAGPCRRMGEVAIESLAALADSIRFCFAMSRTKIRFLFAPVRANSAPRELGRRIPA
jgi:hypothetical protein